MNDCWFEKKDWRQCQSEVQYPHPIHYHLATLTH